MLHAYQKQEVETSSPSQLLIKFYEHAIINIKKAKLNINNTKIRIESITKAINIITALSDTLDMESEAKCVDGLAQLYLYFVNTLTIANKDKDIDKLDEIIHHLEDLLETWKLAIASLT